MARRKGGLYLPLDVGFYDDPRIITCMRRDPMSVHLYLAMCLKVKQLLSDGVLTCGQLARLGIPTWRKRLVPLVDNDLCWPVEPSNGEETWWITAWEKHNESRLTVEVRRERDRSYQRKRRLDEDLSVPTRDRDVTESVWQVEKSREERSTPCVHGAVDNSRCALCRRGAA